MRVIIAVVGRAMIDTLTTRIRTTTIIITITEIIDPISIIITTTTIITSHTIEPVIIIRTKVI